MNNKFLAGVTKGGKEIYVAKPDNSALFKIQYGSGGELPSSLTGGFSSLAKGHRAVKSYLEASKAAAPAKQAQAVKAAKSRPNTLKAK